MVVVKHFESDLGLQSIGAITGSLKPDKRMMCSQQRCYIIKQKRKEMLWIVNYTLCCSLQYDKQKIRIRWDSQTDHHLTLVIKNGQSWESSLHFRDIKNILNPFFHTLFNIHYLLYKHEINYLKSEYHKKLVFMICNHSLILPFFSLITHSLLATATTIPFINV